MWHKLKSEVAFNANIEVFLQRVDLVHPHIQGNKYFKLKYNLEAMQEQGYTTLLTLGGAYSNHIHAVAAAGQAWNFKTIGIIRGEEYKPLNPTLQFAEDCGMELYYLSREEYRKKDTPGFIDQLRGRFEKFYFLPEGGSNQLAMKGCSEIGQNLLASMSGDENFYACCPVGTGTTLAGIIAGLNGHGNVIGFPPLKGGAYIEETIQSMLKRFSDKNYDNYHLETGFHFGGFAKVNASLIQFINDFKTRFGIPLDPVYTGKMMYGILEMIKTGAFPPGSKVVAIHTGGLQGIAGINARYGSLPDIR